MILDTSFIIDLMNKQNSAVIKIQELLHKNEPQVITTISLFELWSGLAQSKKPEQEKTKITNIIKAQTIWPLDEESAQAAGTYDGNLTKAGQQIDPEDCMIAGIAKIKNQRILTNDKHFERIKDIKVEHY